VRRRRSIGLVGNAAAAWPLGLSARAPGRVVKIGSIESGTPPAALMKGANAADLPMQLPTSYELLIKLRTAKAIRAAVPTTVLARADEVIA
jgi:hypothetical protein